MKNLNKIIMAAFVGLAFSSCSITTPVAVSNAELGDSQGISESVVLLGVIYLNGNYGIKEAAESSFITTPIGAIDEKVVSYFLFSKRQLIVTAK
ncbi:MAG: hypothetical protein ACI85Q_002936 [Salibacteraceae bacterium]|jgi:hypothetical protein